MIINNKLV